MLTVLSSNYFGNIQYFSKIIAADRCVVDIHEHYTKQTYRNRCDIMGANGRLTLSVPIQKIHNKKTVIKECLIDYSTQWQKQHLRSIESAYKNSPYFDYFFDMIEPVILKEHKHLVELNNATTEVAMKIIGAKASIEQSDRYVELHPELKDYRTTISPKWTAPDSEFMNVEYYQVFAERHPFEPNLSLLDLIFCEGRNTLNILKESYTQNF